MSSIEELVYNTLQNSISSFFKDKEVKVTHVLDLIFPQERRIRSLIGGLETSLGTTLWEPLAKAFANKGGYTVLDERGFNREVPVLPTEVRNLINNFYNAKQIDPNIELISFEQSLRNLIITKNIRPTKIQKIPKGEGVDLWLKKNQQEFLIDIKTTQINAGSGPKFTLNMLNWIAYRLLKDREARVRCIIAFPFNPHAQSDFWSKEKGKCKPLIPSLEALVADEFWDLLYGKTNTTELILNEFEHLGKTGFGNQFKHIFTPDN